MAVVTKAMGAFLVMMLLLLPYYSSGPIGQKSAEDLAAQVDKIEKDIQSVIDSLKTASPEDLRQRLQEALDELGQAQKLLAELKRANDALNAQVKRLQDDNTTLTAQIAQLQQQLASAQQQRDALKSQVAQLQQQNSDLQRQVADSSKAILMGQVTNWSCPDGLLLVVGAYPLDGNMVFADHSEEKYFFDSSAGLGHLDVGDGKAGRSTSVFLYQGYDGQKLAIVAQSRSATRTVKRKGNDFALLQRPATPCSGQFMLQLKTEDGAVSLLDVVTVSVDPNSYVSVVGDLVATDKAVTLNSPSAQTMSWVQDQLNHAEKLR